MKRCRLRAALAAIAIALAPLAVNAHDDMMSSLPTTYHGRPDLRLTLAVVVAGGGPAHFDALRLARVLAGAKAPAELHQLQRRYGEQQVASFAATFDYAVADTLRLARRNHVRLPASPSPSPSDGRALATALYRAGIVHGGRYNGRFDVGYMLEHLVSHPLHMALMDDIDRVRGSRNDATFHVVLTGLVDDLAAVYHG